MGNCFANETRRGPSRLERKEKAGRLEEGAKGRNRNEGIENGDSWKQVCVGMIAKTDSGQRRFSLSVFLWKEQKWQKIKKLKMGSACLEVPPPPPPPHTHTHTHYLILMLLRKLVIAFVTPNEYSHWKKLWKCRFLLLYTAFELTREKIIIYIPL